MADSCPSCANEVPSHVATCPHCGGRLTAPNVRAAAAPQELTALHQRYQDACDAAVLRGADATVRAFERAASSSRAVICRQKSQLTGLTASNLMSTYWQQVRAEVRFPDTPEWAQLRSSEETRWFANYTEQIHYAALSLDGRGASGWGPIVLVLADRMIEHRTTVGETNVVLFGKRRGLLPGQPVPAGYRATWGERSKLCVAKLSGELAPGTGSDSFAAILLKSTGDRELDDFVEVHIHGPLTLRSLSSIRIPKAFEALFKDEIDELRRIGVGVDIVE